MRGPRKGWAREDTALTDAFSVQQPVVDRTGLAVEVVEVVQATVDTPAAVLNLARLAAIGLHRAPIGWANATE